MVHIFPFRRQALNARQLTGSKATDGGLLNGLLPNANAAAADETATPATATAKATGAAVAAGTTGAAAAITTNTQKSTTPLTTSSPASLSTVASVTTSSVPSTTATSTLSTTSSLSSSTILSTSSSETPSFTAAPAVITSFVADPNGGTSVVVVTSTPAIAAAASPAPPVVGTAKKGSPFLENKAASGVVFAIAGVVGLAILVFLIFTVVKKSRRKHLTEDAVSFNPSDLVIHGHSMDIERNGRSSIEKASYHGSESGHGHGPPTTYSGYTGYDYNDSAYGGGPPPNAYHGNAGYGNAAQQPSYGYNNRPVQLPSKNTGRAPPPASLQPGLNTQEPALPSGLSGLNYGPPAMRAPSPAMRRASNNGSITDNPYVASKDYKVANA